MNAEIEPHILKMFEIKKRIGKGAYGIVWKALNKKTKEIIALKKIFDAFRNQTDAQRTFREIAFLQNFGNHPNIVRLYNVIRASSDKDIYLVFEYMETDLHNVIKKGNILNDIHKQYIMYQLLKATAYLHSGEVIHRDQKPSNVLLNSYCLVKLCDFGLARSLKGRNKYENVNGKLNCKTLLPALTEYVATRWYRAPEILLACHNYTKGVDIWSLGCILGEMLIGTPLFPGTSTLDQIERIMGALPKPTIEDMASVKSPYSSSILQKAHIKNRRSLDQLLMNVDKTATDLMYKMLHFNPHKRITALEALKHPYVRRFYSPNEIMIMNHHVTPPLDDNIQLTVSEYRDRLYQMISSKKTNTTTIMIQNGINKTDSTERKNIITGIPQPITCSTYSHHKKQSTTKHNPSSNHQTTIIKGQDHHHDLQHHHQQHQEQQQQQSNEKNTPQSHCDDTNSSKKNHVVCVQVNLLHQGTQNHSINHDKVAILTPKLPAMSSANDINNNNNSTNCNITGFNNNANQLHNGHHINGNINDYDYDDNVNDDDNYNVLHRSASSSLPSAIPSLTGAAVMAKATTIPLKQQYQTRSLSQNSKTNSNLSTIHYSPVIRSNSVNKMAMNDYQTSKRYLTITPLYYPNQFISKLDVVKSTPTTNQQSYSNLNYTTTTTTTATTTTINTTNRSKSSNSHSRLSKQSNRNSNRNSRITTSNYYYYTANGIDNSSSSLLLLPNYGNSYENIMVNSQKPIDLNYSPQHDNRCKSSQPENLLLDHEYEYLQGINNPYEENDKIDSINNSSQYFLNNEKYCSTPNIQEHLFNDMNIHKTNLYKNEILKVSSSTTTTTTTELSSKIVQSTNSNISNNIKETIIEPITYKSVDQITRNHSCHGNRNNKETILSDTNSTKQLTNEKNYETSFVNLQQNRRNNNNPQSNYESLSLININQKLKLIQGSTDIQNSMFQSKISTSLNNLKMKYHHNQSQSQPQQQPQQPQPQQRQPQQQNDRRRQSDHNGSKYNCMNQLMDHSNHNSNYQKTIKDKNDLDPHLYHKSIEPPLRQYTLSHSSPLMNQDSLSIKRQYSELLSLNSYTTTNTTTTNNDKITSHLPYYNHDQFKSNEKPYQMLTAITTNTTTNTTNNSNSSIVHIGDPSNNLLPQQQQQPQKQQYPNRLIPNDQKHHHPSYLSTLNSIKSSTNSKWINKKNNR